jgi:hypothetical protein
MTTTPKPVKAYCRAYQVGFGDCCLFSIEYSDGDMKHILIDFGTTGIPKDMPDDLMLRVAEDIRARTTPRGRKNGKLHMLIASHRHKDHIGGFSREGQKNEAGETTGDIIRSLNPDVVVQPWTENPELIDKDFEKFIKAGPKKIGQTGPSKLAEAAFSPTATDFAHAPNKHFVSTLMGMQAVAKSVEAEAQRMTSLNLSDDFSQISALKPFQDQLMFMGENNMPNVSAVENLREMGAKTAAHYVCFGDKVSLSRVMPGVKMHVLGPPSLEQHHEILKQRSRDDDEFWMLHAMLKDYWGLQAATAALSSNLNATIEDAPKKNRLFPKARVFSNHNPSHTRWFINQVKNVRARQMMGLVRILDKAMNNTSVIALLEINGHKFLFPGDAQIENWEYAMRQTDKMDLLKDAVLYKVGHHGSRNATPKTLWRNFANRSAEGETTAKLFTVCSTMAGKHGHTTATAVPRRTLVNALKKRTSYHTTEDIKDVDNLSILLEFDLK